MSTNITTPDTAWFEAARYGLFIHWGLYALCAGRWKGKDIPGIGEQIMRFARIPVLEYQKLAAEFNPVEYDPAAIVELAQSAGMKYVVITAKHHDGFAMYPSSVSAFNIVDATPYAADALGPLYEACRKAGLTFCVYYSHRQDWNEPGGGLKPWPGQYDGLDESSETLSGYIQKKALPQVRELLELYPEIGYIWFDTPRNIPVEASQAFCDLVHTAAPHCLINSRVGHGLGDTVCFGDNQTPKRPSAKPAETPATMNHTWGFKADDQAWKSPATIIDCLVECASRGSNLLLNVGPDGLGRIPEVCQKNLRRAGEWLQRNGEAIYGTGPTPFPGEFTWGTATQCENRIYLLLKNRPASALEVPGILNGVRHAYRLSCPEVPLEVTAQAEPRPLLTVELPAETGEVLYDVIVLELDGAPRIDPTLVPDQHNTILLPVHGAVPCPTDESGVQVSPTGLTTNWRPGSGNLQWTFLVTAPGVYALRVFTNRHWCRTWSSGTVLGLLHDGEMWPEPIPYSYGYVSSVLTIIAEVARNTGFEDLYHWKTDDGQSLKNLYDGFLHHAMADGRIANHADAGANTEMGHLFPPERRSEVLRLWGGQTGKLQSKFELAYRAWRDPKHAWLLNQTPERDAWDMFWGIPSLTHGIELGPMEAPDATSRVWRSHGGVLLRADETDTYWGGDLPTVYMRRGHGIGHGHDDSGNIILNAFGRNLYPDHLLGWDYQPRIDPETGKEWNPSHYSKARLAHNTVSMNCESRGEYALSQIGSIQRSGPMNIGRFWGMAPPFRRTIGVTPEYVLDWCAAGRCVGADPHTEHTWDYHLHGLGLPELKGFWDLQSYTTLGEEYGYGPIDTRSKAHDNQWIRPGLSGVVDGPWSAIMREEYPLDPEAVRGVCIYVLGEAGTRVITGHVPDYVEAEGWDATRASVDSLPRLGLLVVRRKKVASDFLVVHQPFCGDCPPPLTLHHDAGKLVVTATGFMDQIDLMTMTCTRSAQ